MPNYGEQLAQQVGSQAASDAMGIILSGFNDQRQIKQQGRLNEQQKGMIDYNYSKQLQMWKDTNYEAQIEQMKKAGLNPALLYGMSGGGGTTTGSGGGGNAPEAPKGGGEMIAMQQMGIQRELLQAQKENIQANTEKTKAETANKPLEGKQIQASTNSLLQGIENAKAQKELTEVQTDIAHIEEYIKGKSQNMAISIINSQAQQAQQTLEILTNEKEISTATKDEKIKIIEKELTRIGLQNALTIAQTKLTDEQKKAVIAGIQNMITERQIKWRELSVHEKDAETRKILADAGVDLADQQLLLGPVNTVLNGIDHMPSATPKRNPIGFK